MATVSSRHIVDSIIANKGKFGSDPPVVKIVEYNNMFNGDLAWGLVYEGEDFNRYEKSAACHNTRTIWDIRYGEVNHG